MKKTKIALICLCVLTVLLLSSCQDSSPKALNSSSVNQSGDGSISITSSNSTMTLGDSYYEQDANWFKNNPIDNAYLKETPADTTFGSAELESKYLTIWQNEVVFSASKLRKRLTPNDATAFDQQQKMWEDWANGNIDFDQSIMNYGDYGIDAGTSRQYIYTDAKINLWRDRDLHLKYLTSLLEAYNAHPLPESQWTWNKFDLP